MHKAIDMYKFLTLEGVLDEVKLTKNYYNLQKNTSMNDVFTSNFAD